MRSPYSPRVSWKEKNLTTIHKLYEYCTDEYRTRKFSRFADGSQAYTYGEFRKECDSLSDRLSRYGIGAGDKVAILSQNMPNWGLAFFSAVAFGRVAIPILPDSSQSEVGNILTHSGSKVLFVSQKLLPKVSQEMMDRLVLVIDIETLKAVKQDSAAFKCDAATKEPRPEDLATIIYTSGTTGSAKGVMLSHRNLCHNIVASYRAHKCRRTDRFLSILPMAHAYEMSIGFLYPVYVGACVYYIRQVPSPTVLIQTVKKVRPMVMNTVPLIMEKVYKNSVMPTIRKSRVLTWMRAHCPGLLYWFIGRRLKSTFGGKLHFFGIGGAKLSPDVESFLIKAHFPYAIGYGLTETAPLVCNAMVGKTRVGSIGIPSYGVEVRLGNVDPLTGEGEIQCRGNNVMLGYYRDPERTAQVLDDDGWLHTNDVACMDKKGNYYIKGRLNNTILGPSGENIYPEEIEKVINNMDGVNESLVMERDGKLVALVKFEDNVLDWNQKGEDKFFETLQARKKAVMDFVNKAVGKNSKINEIEAMEEPFEKTATQKIRRFLYRNFKPNDKA